MMDTETHLAMLDGDAAKNWLTVGQVLTALERQSRAAPSGKLWQDIVRERLAQAGHPVSNSHLYKIRRGYQLLEELAPEALNQDPPPRVSAVDVAERLYRLDPEAGTQALHDTLGARPVTYVELKKRYEEALKEKPELKSSRHIGWEKRKPDSAAPEGSGKGQTGSSDASLQAAREHLSEMPKPPADLQQAAGELAERAWRTAWGMAREHYRTRIEELQQKALALGEKLEHAREENRRLQERNDILAKELRELRGDGPEDPERH